LNITNGGSVSDTDGSVGSFYGSTGTVMVDGAGSTWTNTSSLDIGESGNGTLNITGGGSVSNDFGNVGSGNDTTGTVTVDGAGSTWTNNSNLFVGRSGIGILNITGGGSVINTYGYIGFGSSSASTVMIDGAGSTWTNNSLYVGYYGSGTLNISGDGAVSVSRETYVGHYTSSKGEINFGTGSGTLNTRSLLAAPSQLTGTGTINTRGLVSDIDLVFDATHGLKQTITFNSSPGQNISINLDMTGTPDTNGDLGAGWNDTGFLWIQDGAEVTSRNGYLGYRYGSTGTATVSGAGSQWTNTGSLFIGNYGNGTLNITGGGSVTSLGGYGPSPEAYIGFFSGSTGTVNVDGAGSTWTIIGYFETGYDGSGILNITGGGKVYSNVSDIGYRTGSGAVTVDGESSTWTISSFTIGSAGTDNILNISGGGQVIDHFCDFVTGTVMISGVDSKWINRELHVGSGRTCNIIQSGGNISVSGIFILGFNSTGNVIQTGGTNSIDGTFTLGEYSTGKGVYNLNGGTLILHSLTQRHGTAEFNFGGGTLQASGDFSSIVPMTLTGTGGNANVETNGYAVTLSGVLSGEGGLNKKGTGTLTIGSSNTYEGTTTIGAGTLKLSAGGTIASSAVIDVQSGAVFDVSAKTGGFSLGATQTLRGKGWVSGAVVAAAGSLIEPGDSAGVLTIDGDLTLNEGARLDFDLDTPATSDQISMAASTLFLNNQEFGDFTFHPLGGFGEGTYLLIDAGMIFGSLGSNLNGTVGNLPASLATSRGDLVLIVVPEPGVWIMLAAVVLGWSAFRRWDHECSKTRNRKRWLDWRLRGW
jgi:fibronectin-binding autotransporter adhesin